MLEKVLKKNCLYIVGEWEHRQHTSFHLRPSSKVNSRAFFYIPLNSKPLLNILVTERSQDSLLLCGILDEKEEVKIDREGKTFYLILL